jgi:Fur family peroxide stress response transcriptional regulator
MKVKEPKKSARDDTMARFKAKCRKAGLRITPQRVAIYEQVLGSKEHPSASMVLERVRKQFPEVSLDTVNRTLKTIAELGLARTVPCSGGAKRFDADLACHHHFQCVKCGKIIDFTCPTFENTTLPRDIQEEFTVLTKTVYVQGICKKCRLKLPSNNNVDSFL